MSTLQKQASELLALLSLLVHYQVMSIIIYTKLTLHGVKHYNQTVTIEPLIIWQDKYVVYNVSCVPYISNIEYDAFITQLLTKHGDRIQNSA